MYLHHHYTIHCKLYGIPECTRYLHHHYTIHCKLYGIPECTRN